MAASDRPAARPDFAAVDRNRTAHQAFLLRILDLQNAQRSYQPPKRDVLELLALAPGHSVLEVGCGTGEDARLLAGVVGPTGRVAALDVSAFMLEEARRRSAAYSGIIDFTLGDVRALGYPDNTFDACRCERVLQHVEDPTLALREMIRVTKPGGRIAVADADWGHSLCSDAITEQLWSCVGAGVRNQKLGRQLSALFREAGPGDIHVRPHSIGPLGADCTEAYAESVATMAQLAVDQGYISPAEAAAWPGVFVASGRDGTGFALTPFFVVAGTKPA